MPESTYAETRFQRDAVQGDSLAPYPFSSERFDEMCSAPGTVRPHWQYAMRAFSALGGQELGRRRDEVQQVLRENGVTYNVYTDTQGRTRPWALDVIPAKAGIQVAGLPGQDEVREHFSTPPLSSHRCNQLRHTTG